MSDNLKILIVGAGLIAREYIKVLEALGHNVLVVGRGESNVNKIKAEFPSVNTFTGGLEKWLKGNKAPSNVIVATPIDYLASGTSSLLDAGCNKILVEKPLTYSVEKAKAIEKKAIQKGAEVYIAFNRRSYVSVQKAKELIQLDGGVSSFHFDFTEATFRIDPTKYSNETNTHWGIANSSHVIDTAFYLGGKPQWIESKKYGKAIEWHPTGSIFTGMGETIDKVPFTYHANWGCPGKWNIEIMTPERKLLFSPMEQLHQQAKGGFKVELVELDYSKDNSFKPGFYQQVKKFVEGADFLKSIKELPSSLKVYNQIFGY